MTGNQREVTACVTLMASTLRQEVTALMLEGFCLALADLTPLELRRAIGRALCECRFMPSPAELRGFAGRKAPRQEAADRALYQEPAWMALPPAPLTDEQHQEVRDMIRKLADSKGVA